MNGIGCKRVFAKKVIIGKEMENNFEREKERTKGSRVTERKGEKKIEIVKESSQEKKTSLKKKKRL